MTQLVGCKGNKKDDDQLPQRLLFSKQCYSYANLPNENRHNENLYHGFTLEDSMCFKVKVGKNANQVGCLRMILRGFIYYQRNEDASEIQFNDEQAKGETTSQGHYTTFIYLNDNQWVVLEDKDYFIVSAGYAFFSQNKLRYLRLRGKILIKEMKRK